MKKSVIYIIAFFSSVFPVLCQTPQLNLEKYWIYRERLKDFMVVGDCAGCSLPACKRAGTNTTEPNNTLSWDDETQRLGMYIDMLATEYKLLKDNGQDITQTKKELYYALEAFNRLDIMAEHYWKVEMTGLSPGPLPGDLNGFFIRDDVKNNFYNQVYDGDLIENHLNKSIVPLDDQFLAKSVRSGYQGGVDCSRGPVEESLDQVVELLVSFALVVKCVDENDSYGPAFMDGETRFVQETKNMAARMMKYISLGNWSIINPAYPLGCVQAVSCEPNLQNRSCLPGAGGGGNLFGFEKGFFDAYNQIMTSFGTKPQLQPLPIPPGALDIIAYNALATQPTPGNQEDKFLKLVAISNDFGNNSMNILNAKLYNDKFKSFHVELVNNVLYGNSVAMSGGIYECMLNSAQCRGNGGIDSEGETPNYEWGDPDRFIYGPNSSGAENPDLKVFGLDYLAYFNLYCLSNSGYLGNGYQTLDVKKLCVTDLVKTNHVQHEKRNFLAANKITIGNVGGAGPYVISNDNDPAQSLPYRIANVNLQAGNEIEFAPDFSVEQGVEFSATIDQNLASSGCQVNPPSAECSNCVPGGSEFQADNTYYGEYKIYDFQPAGIFAVTPHNVFKFSSVGGTGDNMFEVFGGPVSGSYLVGYHTFSSEITDFTYFKGNLLISFNDQTMYAYDPSGTGQSFLSGYDNGHQNFPFGNVTSTAIDGNLFIGMSNGMVLQVDNVGSGSNMFAISQSPSSISHCCNPTQYYVGDQKFSSGITLLKIINHEIFIGSGNILTKANPGTGHTMFVGHTLGNQVFGSTVTYVGDVGQATLIGLNDGKTLIVNGSGGTGSNMFAVSETGNTFSPCCNPTQYYIGDQKFPAVLTAAYNDIGNFQNGTSKTILCFLDGTVIKTEYGTGHSFSQGHQLGVSNFGVGVTDFKKIGSEYFLGLGNSKMLKLNSLGSSGLNMWGIADDGCMKNICGYTNLVGCQNFGATGAYRIAHAGTTTEETRTQIPSELYNADMIKVYPNPANTEINIEIPDKSSQICIYNSLGGKVYSNENTSFLRVDVSSWNKGIYFIVAKNSAGNQQKTGKFIVE